MEAFHHDTKIGPIKEIGIECVGTQFFVLIRRADTGEYGRIARKDLEAITLPKQAEPPIEVQPIKKKKEYTQIGFNYGNIHAGPAR